MADILDAAQKQIDEAAKQLGSTPADPTPISAPTDNPAPAAPPTPSSTPAPSSPPTDLPPVVSPPPEEPPPTPVWNTAATKVDQPSKTEEAAAPLSPPPPITTPTAIPEPAPTSEEAPSAKTDVVDTLIKQTAEKPEEKVEETPPTPESKSPPPKVRKTPKGILIAILLFLLATVPLSVFFVAQQRQLAEIRTRATAPYCSRFMNEDCIYGCEPTTTGGRCKSKPGPYPSPTPYCSRFMNDDCIYGCNPTTSGGECKPPPAPTGCTGFKPWGTCTEAQKDVTCSKNDCELGSKDWKCSGKIWNPIYETRECSGSCPWSLTNGKCCPKPPDNCSTPGSKICIKDPFVAECTLWDASCPSGQQYYYRAIAWSSDYEDLVRRYCTNPTPTGPRPSIFPTVTPPTGPQCLRVKIYKEGGIAVDPSTLKPNDHVIIAVAGNNATKGRFRVNGAPPTFTESTGVNSYGEFTLPFTIPEGVTQFTIEAEVFRNGEWQ